MTIRAETRELVRQRAGLACEFCGIREREAGGELTVDHFQPKTKGGTDDPENLVYCCVRCNQYKHDYSPRRRDDPQLLNPRQEHATTHWVELENGTLHPLTPTGTFTIRRLRLNRTQLVENRLHRRREQQAERDLSRSKERNEILERMLTQQAELITELHQLLEEQRDLLRLLLESS